MKKRILSSLLSIILIISILPTALTNVYAITFNQLNDSNVFLKQAGSTTCTLCATTMMMRRYSMLRGDSRWNSITESAIRSTAWVNGAGLRWSFSYSNSSISTISVGHYSLPGGTANEALIQAELKKCPEGIVIYNESVPHAVLLTDYTNGVYYCADPLGSVASGRIPLTSAYKVRITNVTAYWKVTSPIVPGPTGEEPHHHSYSKNYEAAHPHKEYMKCSCGDWYYLTTTASVSSCSQCSNKCTGYNIARSNNHENGKFYDSNTVEITITPHVNNRDAYDSEIVSISLKIKCPDGTVLTRDFGTEKTKSFYFPGNEYSTGTYTFYAYVKTIYGSYTGSPTNGSVSLTLESSTLSGNWSWDEPNYTRIKFDGLNTYLTVDSDGNVVSHERKKQTFSNQDQVWKIVKNSDNTLTIISLANNKALDVNKGVYVRGNNVLSYTQQSSENQKWILCKNGNEGWYFRPASSNSAVLDVDGGVSTNNTNVQLWTFNGGVAQKVSFVYPYQIEYNANGGSGAPSTQYKDYNETKVLSSSKPTRTGYTFLGWSTDNTATSATYSAGGNYTANADVTLYAVWKANTYTVKYNANDGSGTMSNSTYAYGTAKALNTNTFTRPGYTFLGWSTSSSATTATYTDKQSVKNLTSTNNGTVTLYAVWKVTNSALSANSSYNATISTAGDTKYFKYTPSTSGNYVIYSTGNTDTRVYLYNMSSTQLASNDDSGAGQNFRLQYNLTAGTTYIFGVRYYSSSKTGTIPFKFGKVYTITYNANGGSGVPSSQSKDYGTDLTLSSTVPTRTGYTFLGWSTSNTATGATYSAGGNFSANENTTLYAVWKQNPCSHNWKWIIKTDPTCITFGEKYQKCSYCNTTRNVTVLPATGHTKVTVKGYAATCTKAGLTDGVKCSACNETLTAQQTIKAKGHTRVTVKGYAATCTKTGLTDGVKCSVCNTILTAQKTIAVKGHTKTTVKGYAATCTKTGLTDGVKCSACNTTLTAQKTINAKGHTKTTVKGYAATCTKTGLTDGAKCSVCNITLTPQKEIPMLSHTFGAWDVVKVPTASAEGREERACSVCGEKGTRAIAKLNFIMGDTDNNGKVTPADARLVLRLSAGLEKLESFNVPLDAIDMNGDGKIAPSDARTILRKAAGLE